MIGLMAGLVQFTSKGSWISAGYARHCCCPLEETQVYDRTGVPSTIVADLHSNEHTRPAANKEQKTLKILRLCRTAGLDKAREANASNAPGPCSQRDCKTASCVDKAETKQIPPMHISPYRSVWIVLKKQMIHSIKVPSNEHKMVTLHIFSAKTRLHWAIRVITPDDYVSTVHEHNTFPNQFVSGITWN